MGKIQEVVRVIARGDEWEVIVESGDCDTALVDGNKGVVLIEMESQRIHRRVRQRLNYRESGSFDKSYNKQSVWIWKRCMVSLSPFKLHWYRTNCGTATPRLSTAVHAPRVRSHR